MAEDDSSSLIDEEEGATEEEEAGNNGCTLGDHGNFWVMLTLSAIAVVMGQRLTWTCDIIARNVEYAEGFDSSSVCSNLTQHILKPEARENLDYSCRPFFENHAIGFYMWYGTVEGGQEVCLSYTMFIPSVGWVVPTFDTAFRTAKVSSSIANLLGAFGFFTLLYASCCPVTAEHLKGLSWLFLLASVFQCIMFSILASDICNVGFFQQYLPDVDLSRIPVEDVSCSLDTGGKLCVGAAVLYFICATMATVAIAPPALRGYRRGPASEEPTTTTTPNVSEQTQPTTTVVSAKHQP